MSRHSKSTNISIDIKYGKHLVNAEFNVFNSHGDIICNSMWIKDKKQDSVTTKQYFSNHKRAIKKEFYKNLVK